MDAELLSAIVGIGLSLAMSYVPGLKNVWEELQSDYKRAIMGALIIVAGLAVWQGGCQGLWEGAQCEGWQDMARAIVAALWSNQAIYKITRG